MKRNRNWLWFFLVLGCLTVLALSLQLWYNLNQLLRPEQLAQARQIWRERGPASYQAKYLILRHDGTPEEYEVLVEEGKVTSVMRPNGLSLEAGSYPFDRVESLFDHIEERLEEDVRPESPRVFAKADFDPQDGHVLRYIRSVRSPRERLEVRVQLTPPPPVRAPAG